MDEFIRAYNKRLERQVLIQKWTDRIISVSIVYILLICCAVLTYIAYNIFAYGLIKFA